MLAPNLDLQGLSTSRIVLVDILVTEQLRGFGAYTIQYLLNRVLPKPVFKNHGF